MASTEESMKEWLSAFFWVPLIVAGLISLALTYWFVSIPLVGLGIWLIVRGRRNRDAGVAAARAQFAADAAEIATQMVQLRAHDPAEFNLIMDGMTAVPGTEPPSMALLQRRLRIGAKKAGEVMQALEIIGIVGPRIGNRPRQLLISTEMLEAVTDNVRRALTMEG